MFKKKLIESLKSVINDLEDENKELRTKNEYLEKDNLILIENSSELRKKVRAYEFLLETEIERQKKEPKKRGRKMNDRDIELMEEVIEQLQKIDGLYEKDIPTEYIDRIRQLWCDMQHEVDLYTNEDEDIPNLERDLILADMRYEDELDRKWGLL